VAWWVVGTSAAVADMSATLVRRTDGFKHAFERHAGNDGFLSAAHGIHRIVWIRTCVR